MTQEAIILAGGLGTRLRGVVDDLPKPLAPIAGQPFLARLLDMLATQGFARVILATGYRGEQIEAALGHHWHRMELVYSREPGPRGTGGAIALALDLLHGDACFVLNGDTWVGLDYAAFAATVTAARARLGMALARVDDVSRYGAVQVESGRIAGFAEKDATGPGFINAGVYWMARSLQASFPAATRFSFETDVLVPTVAREPVAAFTQTRGFIDIGVPADYQRAQSLFAATGSAK